MFALGVLGVVLVVLVLGVPAIGFLALLVIVALRGDNDDGTRGPAIYASVVSFVALFALLFAFTAAVGSLSELGKDDDDSVSLVPMVVGDDSGFSADDFEFDGDFDEGPSRNDQAWSGAVQALILGAVAAAVLWFHRRLLGWAAALARDTTGGRVWRAYTLLGALVAVLLLVAVLTSGVYDGFRLIAPGVTGAGSRTEILRGLLPLVALGAGAAALFRWHWGQTGLDPLGPPAPPVSPADAP